MLKKSQSTTFKVIIIYNIICVLLAVFFFPLIPNVFNYPPDSLHNEFQKQVNNGLYYAHQYIMIILLTIVISNIVLYLNIKKVDQSLKEIKSTNYKDAKIIKELKSKCIGYPYWIYIFQIFIPTLAIMAILATIVKTNSVLIIKISTVVFAFTTLLALLTYTFSNKIFKNVLKSLDDLSEEKIGVRMGIKNKIFLQIIPIFWVAILFTFLIGYSRSVNEKGELLFETYKLRLQKENFKNIGDLATEKFLAEKLGKITYQDKNDQYFIIKPDGSVITNGQSLSNFFILYTKQKAKGQEMHTYDDYGKDSQGIIEEVISKDGIWTVGIKYNIYSDSSITYLFASLILLSILSFIVLYYFAKDLSEDIGTIAKSLNKIALAENIDYDKKLPVTSNDEIGDLVISFNKILDLEKKNIEKIERNQAILLDQERLSSLGQLIGGIAHNLKTPIMSIAGALEGMIDLVKEYNESVDDKNVTSEDHHEIAKEMSNWIEKIRPYLSYMTEVIDTVKGQAVSMNASTMKLFKVKELVARTKILLKDELKRKQCTLNLDVQIDENSLIAGEISAIIQVIDNLIINAMDSYKGEPGNIDFKLREDDDKVYIEIKDYGSGIPESVQERLFKEMVTSKGKNGTGLGLYMSYSTIKGKFNGDLRYETKIGEGTAFFIELNKDNASTN